MNKPTPEQKTINQFIETLKSIGGKAGNKKLQETLQLNDTTYTWVRDYLIEEGQLKPGRGRGGSVKLLEGEEAQQAKEAIQAKKEAASIAQTTIEDEHFDLEEVKAKYKKLPDEITAFEQGMHVVRPMLNMFSEERAWKHMKHYTVTKTMEGYVFVKPRPTKKDSIELSSPPEGFYQAIQ